jgi:RNA polymerase sigma-70 factor (ECF subfamily)
MEHTSSTLSADELLVYRAWLRRLALVLVGETSADDLVQIAMVAALRRPPEVDRDVRPWFAQVLRNFARQLSIGNARRRAREAEFSAPVTDALPSAEDALIRHEAERVVARLVSGLSEPHRSTVLLHFAEGIPLKDIALRQGLPAGTVRRRLKEALDELRARLDRHYRGEQREWRAVLLPLASAARQTVAPMTPAPFGAALKPGLGWRGVLLMNTKIKFGIIIGLAVLALWGAHSLWTTPAHTSAPAANEAAPPSAAETAVSGSPSARGSSPGLAHPAARRPPPSFATAGQAAALDTLESCQRELEKLSDEVGEEGPSTSALRSRFDDMPPSPKNQRLLAPHLERILEPFKPMPQHTLDCRVGRCRLTLLVPAEVDATPWMTAIRNDGELSKLLGAGGALPVATSTTPPRKIKDALSGAELQDRQLFFSVPEGRQAEHPFEVAGESPQAPRGRAAGPALGACRERVQTLRKELEARRQENEAFLEKTRGLDGNERFFAAAPNPELTRGFQLAVDALVSAGAVPAGGTVRCRGERDCRFWFQGRHETEMSHDLVAALGRQGYLSETTITNPRWARQSDGRPYSPETTVMVVRLARTDVGDRPKAEP